MPPTIIYHPDVATVDLPMLGRPYPGLGLQILGQIHLAVLELAHKGVPSSDMDPPYQGWYRKKFFSTPAPAPGMRTDLRLIYQWSEDGSELRILAVGKRILMSPDDVYKVHATRSRSF